MMMDNLPETVLLISLCVGGFWCIFVCACHFFRNIAKTARKNRVVYRASSRTNDNSALQPPNEHAHNQTPLHHGSRPVCQQESLPLRPLFITRQITLPSTSVPLLPHRRGREGPNTDDVTADTNMFGLTDYIRTFVPEYSDMSRPRIPERGRILSPGREDHRLFSPGCEFPPSVNMDEAPPPYDSIAEHYDLPVQPPAYEHLFPERAKS